MISAAAQPLFPNSTYSNPLTNSAAEKYLTEGATQAHLTNVMAVNYDTAVRTVTLYIIPDGGSVADSKILMQFNVLPGATPATWQGDKLIPEKSSIYAKIDSGSSVNLFMDGWEDGTVS